MRRRVRTGTGEASTGEADRPRHRRSSRRSCGRCARRGASRRCGGDGADDGAHEVVLSPREKSYEFVPGTRPGGPDTKLCSEHIFDQVRSQALSRTSGCISRDTLEHVFVRTRDRIQFRSMVRSQTATTDIGDGRRDMSDSRSVRGRVGRHDAAQGPHGQAGSILGVDPAMHRPARLSAEHARDRRRRRPRVALERDPPAQPARAQPATSAATRTGPARSRCSSTCRRPRRPRSTSIRPTSDDGDAAHVPLVGRIAAGIPITAEQQVEEVLPLPRQLVGKGDLFMLKRRRRVHDRRRHLRRRLGGRPPAADARRTATSSRPCSTTRRPSRSSGSATATPGCSPATAPSSRSSATTRRSLGKVVPVLRSV